MLIARRLYKHDVDRQMVNPSRNDNNSSSGSSSSSSNSSSNSSSSSSIWTWAGLLRFDRVGHSPAQQVGATMLGGTLHNYCCSTSTRTRTRTSTTP
eukprot:9306047-Heterocapsa_arctica.AAC.1